jgi:hypothetical protein
VPESNPLYRAAGAVTDLRSRRLYGRPSPPATWPTRWPRAGIGCPIGRSRGCCARRDSACLRANAKVTEGRQHVDRDAQFGYLNAAVVEHLAIGALVVSVDTKKKELVGEFYNGGPQAQVAASRCSRRFGVRPRRSQSAAGLDSAEEHLDHEADDEQVEDHLRDDDHAGAWLVAVISPKPTVAKTVTVKYSESVRVRESTLKLSGLYCSIMKSVDQETGPPGIGHTTTFHRPG